MNIATINGQRLLIMGLGDGGVYAMKPQTGEKVWGKVVAKRGLNTGVVVNGNTVIISHGDENLDSTERGMIAAIDGSQKGDIKTFKWAVEGLFRRIFLADHRWRPRLSDRERVEDDRVRCRDRQGVVEAAAWAPCRRLRRCSPTGRFTSARRAGSFSSCGRIRIARNSERSRHADLEISLLQSRRHAGAGAGAARRFRTAGCSSFRATRSTRSVRRKPNALNGLRRR